MKIWKKITGLEPIEMSIDDIMAIGSIKVNDSENKVLTTEVLRTLITTAIWSIWKNRNDRIFKDKKETKERQIETWKANLIREIEIEYELIAQANIRRKDELTKRFMKKWTNDLTLIRIEVNKKGKRRLIMEL